MVRITTNILITEGSDTDICYVTVFICSFFVIFAPSINLFVILINIFAQTQDILVFRQNMTLQHIKDSPQKRKPREFLTASFDLFI